MTATLGSSGAHKVCMRGRHLPPATSRRSRRCRPDRQKVATEALVTSHVPFTTWLSVAAIAAAGQGLEKRSPIGRVASAPVVVMTLAAVAAGVGVLPSSSDVYSHIWSYIMPMGAALCLLEADVADVARVWKSVRPVAIAWAIGAVGVVAGTLCGWLLLHDRLGAEGAKVAAALAASYVGGSLNFAATASALNLAPGALMAGAMAADNVAMAVYLALISSWPVRKLTAGTDSAAGSSNGSPPHACQLDPAIMLQDNIDAVVPMQSNATVQSDANEGHVSGSDRTRRSNAVGTAATMPPATDLAQQTRTTIRNRVGSLAAAVAAAAAACVSGRVIAKTIGFAGGDLACMAFVAVALAAAATAVVDHQSPHAPAVSASPFAGCGQLGGCLMLPFFVSIGAAAGSLSTVLALGWTFAFIAVQLTVHVAFSVTAGRFLDIPLDAILTASNANIGGPATAAATATARGWPHMVQPAVLTGSLGYAVGTAIGCGVYTLLV